MKRTVIDMTGQKVGRLTVLRRDVNSKDGRAQWLCECECGNQCVVRGKNLRKGITKSCGCLQRESVVNKNYIHGKSHTRLNSIWRDIKRRCYDAKRHSYPDYGGRGIKMCDEWKDDFMNFYNWAMENGYTDELTIDRIDVNGNYEPNNCKWATYKEQANNKRNTVNININNTNYTFYSLSKITNINQNKLRSIYYKKGQNVLVDMVKELM